MLRNLSFSDRLVSHVDNALKTLTPGAVKASHVSPGAKESAAELSVDEQKHIAGLMRINHTGEVCAQALYQGQSLTARLPAIRASMEQAADEELDHLAWCEDRINELGGRTSLLNPAFYGLSYALGAIAGIAGDKWSLGFVAATEDQVSLHLQDHLEQIGAKDARSSAILRQMLSDEEQHAHNALEAGGVRFSSDVKTAMTAISKVMTQSAYRL
jgi:ubiquinone biosynthesis monooxygenase Coq7